MSKFGYIMMCILIPNIISLHYIGCNTIKKEEEPTIQYKK